MNVGIDFFFFEILKQSITKCNKNSRLEKKSTCLRILFYIYYFYNKFKIYQEVLKENFQYNVNYILYIDKYFVLIIIN